MKFRKKPVVISAEQFNGKPVDGMCRSDERQHCYPYGGKWHCHTLEGPLLVSRGDWIITGIKGERYPCKPEIFAATYEAVE